MRADALVYELLEGTMSVRENAPKPIRRSIVPVCRSRPPDMFVTTNVAAATETPAWPGGGAPNFVCVDGPRPGPPPGFPDRRPVGSGAHRARRTRFPFGLASTA